jgi:transcriptional regulator with XRE-family HTH domain
MPKSAPKSKLSDLEIFAANFTARRKELDLTTTELHRRTGIARSFLRQIGTGERNVSLALMSQLAAELDIPLYRLLMPND